MRLDRNSYGLAPCEQVEVVDLDSDELELKKIKHDPEVATMQMRNKGKELPGKTKEEIHKEALEKWENIKEAHMQHKKEIGMGTSQGTNTSIHPEPQHDDEVQDEPIDISQSTTTLEKVTQIALTAALIHASKGKYPVEGYNPFSIMQLVAAIPPDTYSTAHKYAEHKGKAEERDVQEVEYLKGLISMQQMALTMFERNKEEIRDLRHRCKRGRTCKPNWIKRQQSNSCTSTESSSSRMRSQH